MYHPFPILFAVYVIGLLHLFRVNRKPVTSPTDPVPPPASGWYGPTGGGSWHPGSGPSQPPPPPGAPPLTGTTSYHVSVDPPYCY